MSTVHDDSCGCGVLAHPPPPVVPAGLAVLAERQWAGFPEYRAALLAGVPGKGALRGWRAQGAGDLGVMLLEAWSYVLDVTGFYDARIAERCFLPTAPDQDSAWRLVALLGHRPRPAMAASVRLVVEADGSDPVTLRPGTSFRSEPFEDEPPQVFELAGEALAWPVRNRWELAPVRADTFDGVLRFGSGRTPSVGAVVVLSAGSAAVAGRVAAVDGETALDGETYQRVTLHDSAEGGPGALMGKALSGVAVDLARLAVAPTALTGDAAHGRPAFVSADGTEETSVVLDAWYPQVRPGDRAAAEVAGTLHAVVVQRVELVTRELPGGTDTTPSPQVPLTEVTFTPPVSIPKDASFTLHVHPLRLAAPTRPAVTTVGLGEVEQGASLQPPVAELGDAPAAGAVVLRGARKRGELLHGTVVSDGDGGAQFVPAADAAAFTAPLAAPVTLFGNVVEAVRGETVVGEVLGSADASRPFNTFTLRKSPLTWVEDPSRPDGRRPELSVSVDGVAWTRVDTFFGQGPDDRVYVVRQDSGGEASVVFGDGARGARPPTGSANVRATYRHGAGGATPPPGAIAQVAVPVPGLASVRSPLPAQGGADAERAEELRHTAPASALTLGRAVSVADFEALARTYPGVRNVAAGWAWDRRRQRAGVKLWVIAQGAHPGDDLVAWLERQAAPGVGITVEPARRDERSALSITVEVAAGHDPDLVRPAVRAALFEPDTGLLSSANVAIGRPLFRSVLVHRLHAVPGVAGVSSVLLAGVELAAAVSPGEGGWFDLEAEAVIA